MSCGIKSRMRARAFSYQAPLLWNQLPPSVREADSHLIKRRLKTFLFDRLIIRAESGSPGPAPWYAAIGLLAAGGRFRIHWAPLSSSRSTYGWMFISPSHIINSASSPESLWLHVSLGPLDLAGSDASCLASRPPVMAWRMCPTLLDRGPCLRSIHTFCHTRWMCCNSVMLSSGHMTSIASVHPGRGILLCCSPEGFSSLFSPWKGFFYFLGVFPDPMWGLGTGMSYRYRL